MASDWKIEDNVSGSETAHKQCTLPDGWHFMYAGVQARAVELVISVREHLETHPLAPPRRISRTLKEAIRKHREKIVCGFYEGTAVIFLIDETRGEPIARPIENFALLRVVR